MIITKEDQEELHKSIFANRAIAIDNSFKILSEVTGDLKYKDGWEFSVDRLAHSFFLHVRLNTTDVSEKFVPIGSDTEFILPFRLSLPACILSRKQWEATWMDYIVSIEVHEAREFFEVKGKKPFYPDHTKPFDVPWKPRPWVKGAGVVYESKKISDFNWEDDDNYLNWDWDKA